jgi:lactose/L-arabinose transport system substrate-binding protein
MDTTPPGVDTTPNSAPSQSPSVIPSPVQSKTPYFAILGVVAAVIVAAGAYAGWQLWRTPSPTASNYVPPAQQTPNDNAGDANTITVWAWSDAALALKDLVPPFEAANPGIKVNIVTIPYNTANDTYRIAISTGTGYPDVWDSEVAVTAEFIKSGALSDITDLAQPYKDKFVPYKWNEVSHSGRVYAIPWDSAPVGLFYRRDIFQKAGVNPDTIKTWDDFIAAGKLVTKDLNGDGIPDQYMTLMSHSADVDETFLLLLSQFGGTFFTETGEPAFNSPEGLQAASLMKRIYSSGIVADIPWWSPEMYEGLKNSKIISFAQGVWFGGAIKSTAPDETGKWGVIPLPAVREGGVRSAVRGGSNLGITALSTKKAAAWKFIQFVLTQRDNQLKMYRDHGIFPALLAAYTDPAFSAPNAYFGNQAISPIFLKAQSELTGGFYYDQINRNAKNIVSTEIINYLNGKKNASQALGDAEKQILNEAVTP